MIGKLVAGVVIGGAIGALLGCFGKCSSGACPLTANPYRGALYGAVMGIVLTLAFSRAPRAPLAKPGPVESGKAAVTVAGEDVLLHIESEADFNARVLDAGGISLVDLFSNRCPPCRALAPIISSLADKYAGKVIVCKVNVDRAPAVAQRYGIRAIPTVIFLKDSKEIKRLVGLKPEEDYAAILDGLIEQDER